MTSTEHQTVGFETESKYRLRLVGYPGALGAQSQIDWQRKRYAIDGDPRIYNGPRPEPDWRALWPESAHPLSAARPRMAYAEVKRVSKLADPLKRRGRKAGRAQGHARSSSGLSTCRIPRAPAVLTDHSPHRGEKSLTQRRSSQGHAHHQRKRRVPWRSSPLPRLTRRLVIAIRMR